MFFEKSNSEKLDINLFKNPTAEYRGAPFWSWNCKLNKEILEKQIIGFKKMGLGGFNMHARVGLDTEYLGEEFMEMVKFCTKKAEENGLYAWLYDEDKWPSGHAGGRVAKDMKFRERDLIFTVKPMQYTLSKDEFINDGTPLLIACYDIVLDSEGYMVSWNIIDDKKEAVGTKWYAFACPAKETVWLDDSAYLDAMDPEATNKFIEYTHEEYKKAVGDEFGKRVPYIFTDEPRAAFLSDSFDRRAFSTDTDDICFAWSKRLDEEYEKEYNEDIRTDLPELMWERADKKLPKVRHNYYALLIKLFNKGFMEPYAKWCNENGLGFTGHLMAEDDLISQTMGFGGECMPAYKYFDVPGVDVLMADKVYVTVKQAQSAVRQLGKEAMLSELYGVTGWDFDFRGHKLEGDWQAAMGVTLRVHHLTYLTMEGAAKRDYPASIGYQSPWCDEYSWVEDHFARLNTVLTRGKPIVKVGVIHPIESFWLKVGPQDLSGEAKAAMERDFAQLTEILALGNTDFDFISESMLPELCKEGSNPIKVGEMEYDAIVIPDLTTIRKTTAERLLKFKNDGGNLVIIGSAPEYIDLEESELSEKLAKGAKIVSLNKKEILSALAENSLIEIYQSTGDLTDNFIYQLRQDGDSRWLFLAHANGPKSIDTPPEENLIVKVKGEFKPELYDTQTGEIHPLSFEIVDGKTVIKRSVYAYDSLLIKLSPAQEKECFEEKNSVDIIKKVDFKKPTEYKLSEENALLLDRAEYSLDGEEYHDEEEILALTEEVKERLGWPSSGSTILQPWLIEKKPAEHKLSLRFKFDSEIDFEGAYLAIERPEIMVATFNGEKIELVPEGYFVDASIKKIKLPKIKTGENVLEVTMDFDMITFPEWIYILGDFGVRLQGACGTIINKPLKLGFSSTTEQNLPFYTGNISFREEIEVPECDNVKVKVSSYRGGLVKVLVDGEDAGRIVYAPYTLDLGKLAPGKHTVEFVLFGNRYNAFAALHNYDTTIRWCGPGQWFTRGDKYGYEYQLRPMGILKSPEIYYEKVLVEK